MSCRNDFRAFHRVGTPGVKGFCQKMRRFRHQHETFRCQRNVTCLETAYISLLDCIDPDIEKAAEKVYNKIVTKAKDLVH
mgnify:CR=1 FL=1